MTDMTTDLNLLSLGMFIFATSRTAIDEIHRSSSWRWGTGNAVGVRPRMQYIGPDNDTYTLPGILYPELTDGAASLDTLRRMANSGKFFALIGGEGTFYGLCAITDIDETKKHLMQDGSARKIEFSISLKLVDDSDRTRVAVLGFNKLLRSNHAPF